MLARQLNAIARYATGRNVLITLAIFLAFVLVGIPAFYPTFDTLDTLLSYTPEKAYQLFDSYGPQGRQEYLVAELTLDLAFPLVLGLFFTLLSIYLLRRAFPAGSAWQKLAFVPAVAMLVDYFENTCVVILLLSYPARLPWLAQIANLFTGAKFALTGAEVVVVLIAVLGWARRKLLVRQGTQALP